MMLRNPSLKAFNKKSRVSKIVFITLNQSAIDREIDYASCDIIRRLFGAEATYSLKLLRARRNRLKKLADEHRLGWLMESKTVPHPFNGLY